MATSGDIKPLANADEWQRGMVRDVIGVVHAYVASEHGHASVKIIAPGAIAEFDRAEALVPLINDALPDGHPNKITALDVAAITNLAQGYRDPEYVAAASQAAGKLMAMLRPDRHA